METLTDRKSLAIRYIEAAGNNNLAAVRELLTPDLKFKGPNMSSDSADAFLAALQRMSPIWERSAIRAAFAEGDQACIIYDFVTNTAAGAIPTVELLSFRDDRIASVDLFFDRVQFAPAMEELAKRSQR